MSSFSNLGLSALLAIAAACGGRAQLPYDELGPITAEEVDFVSKGFAYPWADSRVDIHEYIPYIFSTRAHRQSLDIHREYADTPEDGIVIIYHLLRQLKDKPLPEDDALPVLDSLQKLFKLDQPLIRKSEGPLTNLELAHMLSRAGDERILDSNKNAVGGEISAVDQTKTEVRRKLALDLLRRLGIEDDRLIPLVNSFVGLAEHLPKSVEKRAKPEAGIEISPR